MPLSEEELRVLQQMERALVEEDPKFASALRGSRFGRAARMRALAAGLVFLAGGGILMTGAVTARTWVGIVGFVIMLASATVGLAAWRGGSAGSAGGDHLVPDSPAGLSVISGGKAAKHPGRSRRPKARQTGSFMSRMESRWQRRRERGGF